MDRGEIAIANTCADTSLRDTKAAAHRIRVPGYSSGTHHHQPSPPCPASHQLYGNYCNASQKKKFARRKGTHLGSSGSAYTNSNPNNPPPPRVNANGRRTKSICIQFLTKGTCAYGSKCKFSHEYGLLSPDLRQALLRPTWFSIPRYPCEMPPMTACLSDAVIVTRVQPNGSADYLAGAVQILPSPYWIPTAPKTYVLFDVYTVVASEEIILLISICVFG